MTAETFCGTVAVFNLLAYWLSGTPAVWAAAVELAVEEGATAERARMKLGWNRLALLSMALVTALLGALP